MLVLMVDVNVMLDKFLKFPNPVTEESKVVSWKLALTVDDMYNLDDYYIMMAMLRNKNLTAIEIRNLLVDIRNVHVSERTKRRYLNATTLMARKLTW